MMLLWLFILICIPLGLIIGVATSTISFTSWSIIVPFLFVGFGYGLYESLYFAVIIDLVDGLILVGIFTKQKKIDYKTGLMWSIPMLMAEMVGLFFMQNLLVSHTDLLKGGIGFFVIAVANLFLYKGFRETKIEKTIEIKIDEKINGKSENSFKIEEKTTVNSLDSGKVKKFAFFDHFDNKLTRNVQHLVILIGVLISGTISGFLGVGSGTNYTLLFLMFLEFDLLKATGTGSLMMTIAMLTAAIGFFHFVDISLIWLPLVIAITFSALGTLIGARWAFRLSRAKLNYMVGGALLTTGIIATIQSFLFS